MPNADITHSWIHTHHSHPIVPQYQQDRRP